MCDLHEAAQNLAVKMNGTAVRAQSEVRKTISLDAERFLRTALEGCGTSALQSRWHMQTTAPDLAHVSSA